MIEVHKIGKTWVIKKGGAYNATYRINGEHTVTLNADVAFSVPIDSIEIELKKPKLIGYGPENISQGAYQKLLANLRTGAEWDEGTDTWLYLTIVQRDQCRSFIEKYRPNYETKSQLDNVEFVTYTHVPSGDPRILPLRLIGELNPLFKYETNWMLIYEEVGKKHGIEFSPKTSEKGTKTWTDGGNYRDDMRYLKIGGMYIPSATRRKRIIAAGTLEECNVALQADIRHVEAVFREYFTKTSTESITNVGELYSAIETVESFVSKMDPKVADNNRHRFALGKIREIKAAIIEKKYTDR